MIECGTVIESKSDQGQAVVRVNILGRETQWLPVLQTANSFKRAFTPVRAGTQVVVLENRYVLGALFCNDAPEPSGASETCEVTEYDDGTRITYDTAAKTLSIDGAGDMVIHLAGDATVKAEGNVNVTATSISLNGGSPCVTTGHICHFTGNPHGDGSSTVTAGF